MDIEQLVQWIKNIKVKNQENSDVEVKNDSPLEMLGKGRQGAVFKITDDICVKVFGNKEDCDREHYALSLGKHTDLFPSVHAKGSRYIVMDLIKGIDLREYLQSQPLTPELSAKLIEMLITFKEIGFERIDHHKRQIYIQPEGNLKVIDVARTVWRDRVYPYPRKLLTSLGEENKQIFLKHVQEMAPKVYEEWEHYIRMEEMARYIMEKALPENDKEKLREISKQLITTNDEEKYVKQLEGLVKKVFKEEWIKAMIARGANPDKVMKKIDEYLLYRETRAKSDRSRDEERNHSESRYSGSSRRDSDKHQQKKRFEGESYHDRDPKSRSRKRRHH